MSANPLANVPLALIAGLGNPGTHYRASRHNLGFHFIARMQHDFPHQLKSNARFHAEMGDFQYAGETVRVLCPTTYMNRSGQAVAAVARFYGMAAAQILVVHDEIDLPVGVVRLKIGGGHGGHNGLRDICHQLGTRDFCRLRLGVGHPGTAVTAVTDYVLSTPRPAEQAQLATMLETACAQLPHLLVGDITAAQQALHQPRVA